ncbi:hypothetical protein, partial [Bacillus mycoides]|nr:hypothetical protein [Bacillus mycoides]
SICTRTLMFDPSAPCDNNSPWLKIDGRWYLFNPGGKLVRKEGWEQSSANGKWMYWIPGNYGLATNESRVIDGVTYYFDSNGYINKNESIHSGAFIFIL